MNSHRIIFSGIEDIKQDLRKHFRISLGKKDWFNQEKNTNTINQNIIKEYNSLKKKFFMRRVLANNYLLLDKKEINYLTHFFHENSSFSDYFLKVSNALSDGWACWVILDNQNLEWNFHLQPIDELSLVRELFSKNRFVFLSALRRDYFFSKYMKQQNLDIDLQLILHNLLKKILLYALLNKYFLIIQALPIKF